MPVHTPQFDDTTTGEWNKPALEDFDTDDLSDVDDHFVGSETQFPPENYGDLILPVVDPAGRLNLRALRNARARLTQVEGLTQDEMERAASIIARLANENFEDADFSEELSDFPEGDMETEQQDDQIEEESEQDAEQEQADEEPDVEVRSAAQRFFEEQQGTDGYETRQLEDVEFRADGEEGKITGFPARFDVPHEVGEFREVFREGAFSKTIREQGMSGSGIVALFNHNPDFPIGRQGKGTLDLEERERGLFMEADPPDSPLGENVLTAVRRGDVERGSVGMKVTREDFDKSEDGVMTREVKEAKLRDVGPVTFPASHATDMEARDDGDLSIITRADAQHEIDVYRLLNILRRCENGEIRSETDRAILRNQIDHLKSLAGSDTKQVNKEKLDRRLRYAEQI